MVAVQNSLISNDIKNFVYLIIITFNQNYIKVKDFHKLEKKFINTAMMEESLNHLDIDMPSEENNNSSCLTSLSELLLSLGMSCRINNNNLISCTSDIDYQNKDEIEKILNSVPISDIYKSLKM